MNRKNISPIADIHALVIQPINGGIVTKKDQASLSGSKFDVYPRPTVYFIHFAVSERDAVIERVRRAKVSKAMRVTEITDAQFGNRYKTEETIAGTGIAATALQIKRSFVIGV